MYIENPKTKGSGIYCAIPQHNSHCNMNCKDCFCQNGRSYLEPLSENLPNIPTKTIIDKYVIRVNDGLDSGQNIQKVISTTYKWPNKFYNTSRPDSIKCLSKHGPVVLTLNPSTMTDCSFYNSNIFDKYGLVDENIMFVRFRANMWNQSLLRNAVKVWCTNHNIPLVITHMRYYDNEPKKHGYSDMYTYKKHVLNSYWSINKIGWDYIYDPYAENPLVSTCGFSYSSFLCKHCGVCLREYWRSIDS